MAMRRFIRPCLHGCATLARTACMALALAACAASAPDPAALSEVYVADFRSDDIEHCRPSDVNLSHADARSFFLRAKPVEARVLHDHYNHAPCYIVGTLKHRSAVCDWEIRAGATGHIRCGPDTWYFACDACGDLFKAH